MSREVNLMKAVLQNVSEPNLFRDTFSYDRIPGIRLGNETVPMRIPEKIWITDTTFRDGQQSRPPYTVEQIVRIFEFMHRISGRHGLIRQSEFFLYSPNDRAAVEACMELGYEFPEVTAWIRAAKTDFELVKSFGLKETGILTSCSDYHIFLKLKKTVYGCCWQSTQIIYFYLFVHDLIDCNIVLNNSSLSRCLCNKARNFSCFSASS